MSLDLSKNFFELFELPLEYSIKEDELSHRFRKLQSVVHPDRYVNGLGADKSTAIRNSAYVNQAYNALKDPLSRANYLLKLSKPELDQEIQQSAAAPSSGFLMEQMEFREELEAISHHNDALAKLKLVRGDIDTRQALLYQIINDCFLSSPLSDANIQKISQAIQKLQFYKKLIEEIKHIQFEHES